MVFSSYDNAEYKLDSGLTISAHEENTSQNRENVLILLHGLGAHSGTWRKNIPYLSREGRTIIAPSLSRTNVIPSSGTIESHVRNLRRLIAKLEVKHVSLIGNSMGGWIAMRLTILYPRLVSGIVLEDTAGVGASSVGIEDNSDSQDLLERVNETSVPTLIIWGKHDPVILVEEAKIANSKIIKSKLIVFDDAGHVPHWEQPEKFNTTVDKFLNACEKNPSKPFESL